MYTNELEIAKQAEKMLSSSLQNKTASFADHINRPVGKKSIKDATAIAKGKKYNTTDNGKKYYMRSLAIQMEKHGFVQHYGVDTIREDKKGRTRQKPNSTTYSFKAHTMKMKAKPFISDAIEQSGVIDFVLKNITTIRAEEILVVMKRTLENK